MESSAAKAFIESFIADSVRGAGTITRYREPLVGFAAADDPAWAHLRQIVEPSHLLPVDLLSGAKTVVAFFLPFTEEVVGANRRSRETAEEWAIAYRETNALINRTANGLIAAVAGLGIRGAAQPSTHNWDPVTLVSGWSHKSAATIAGLGNFGLHRMLITDLGCAGRCGSLAIDVCVEPTSRVQPQRCRYFYDGSCTFCVDECPVDALVQADASQMNLDKHRCYDHILRVAERWGADCCGKCAVGPCALGSAV